MKSAARFWVTPHLASTPASPSPRFEKGGLAVRSVADDPMAYGLTSRCRFSDATSSPASVAAPDRRKMPGPTAIGTGARCDTAFLRRTWRSNWMPQSCDRPCWKRSDLKGICISTDQPPSKRPVRTSQTAFQSVLGLPSSLISKSKKPPIGFTMKARPLRRS